MKIGQDNARQTDTHNLNTHIIDMIFHQVEEPTKKALAGLHPSVKVTQGFNNKYTGRLLCPVHMDWQDPA